MYGLLIMFQKREGNVKILTVIAASIVIFASSEVHAKMTADEIKSEIIGKSWKFESKTGGTGRIKFSSNGKSRLSNTNFDPKRDKGTWRFKGNRHCVSWEILRDGKEKCFSFTRKGDKEYQTHDGTRLFK